MLKKMKRFAIKIFPFAVLSVVLLIQNSPKLKNKINVIVFDRKPKINNVHIRKRERITKVLNSRKLRKLYDESNDIELDSKDKSKNDGLNYNSDVIDVKHNQNIYIVDKNVHRDLDEEKEISYSADKIIGSNVNEENEKSNMENPENKDDLNERSTNNEKEIDLEANISTNEEDLNDHIPEEKNLNSKNNSYKEEVSPNSEKEDSIWQNTIENGESKNNSYDGKNEEPENDDKKSSYDEKNKENVENEYKKDENSNKDNNDKENGYGEDKEPEKSSYDEKNKDTDKYNTEKEKVENEYEENESSKKYNTDETNGYHEDEEPEKNSDYGTKKSSYYEKSEDSNKHDTENENVENEYEKTENSKKYNTDKTNEYGETEEHEKSNYYDTKENTYDEKNNDSNKYNSEKEAEENEYKKTENSKKYYGENEEYEKNSYYDTKKSSYDEKNKENKYNENGESNMNKYDDKNEESEKNSYYDTKKNSYDEKENVENEYKKNEDEGLETNSYDEKNEQPQKSNYDEKNAEHDAKEDQSSFYEFPEEWKEENSIWQINKEKINYEDSEKNSDVESTAINYEDSEKNSDIESTASDKKETVEENVKNETKIDTEKNSNEVDVGVNKDSSTFSDVSVQIVQIEPFIVRVVTNSNTLYAKTVLDATDAYLSHSLENNYNDLNFASLLLYTQNNAISPYSRGGTRNIQEYKPFYFTMFGQAIFATSTPILEDSLKEMIAQSFAEERGTSVVNFFKKIGIDTVEATVIPTVSSSVISTSTDSQQKEKPEIGDFFSGIGKKIFFFGMASVSLVVTSFAFFVYMQRKTKANSDQVLISAASYCTSTKKEMKEMGNARNQSMATIHALKDVNGNKIEELTLKECPEETNSSLTGMTYGYSLGGDASNVPDYASTIDTHAQSLSKSLFPISVGTREDDLFPSQAFDEIWDSDTFLGDQSSKRSSKKSASNKIGSVRYMKRADII